jgi:outer membrane immunogenic protein
MLVMAPAPTCRRLFKVRIRFVQKIFVVLVGLFLGTNVNTVKAEEVDWSGPYVGLTAGYGGLNYQLFEVGPAGQHFNSDQHSMSGILGGVSAGYDWNTGNFLVGFEADLSKAGLKNEFSNDTNWGCLTVCHNQLDWLGTARLRIGKPMGNILPFASAGLAWGGIQQDSGDNFLTLNKIASGWTVGAGVETAINEHISMKLELNYVDLSEQYYSVKAGMKDSDFIFGQIGLNYRF